MTEHPETPDTTTARDRITFDTAIAEAARVLHAGEMVHETTMRRYNDFAQTWLSIAAVINDRENG